MAFNFGNWLEEAWANVNPFDNGATAKTVVAARKRKAAPAVTPAQTSSPTRIGGSNQLASPKAVQLTMPKTPTISTTKLMNKDEIMAFNFGNRKKNLAEIDAIQKKAQADIWDPAKIAGDIGKSVGQVASGAAKGVVDAGTGMINDYGKRVADTGEAAATVIRQLNGENQAFDKHMQDLATNANQTDINVLKRLQTESDPMKRKQLQKVLSLDARGTAINSMQNAQQQQLQATDPRKTLVNAGNTALDVLTLGKGKAILDGVRATQKVTAPVLRQLAKNTALSFLQGAGIGAAYSGVNTAIDPNASPLDYARNMGQGAAMGAAVGLGAQVVFPVAGVAAKQAVKGTESAIVRSANYGLKPPTNLSKDELYIASKVRQAREGYISPQDITVQEAAIYQNVQRKLGAKPGTPDGEMAVVHALGAHRNFDTQRTLRKDATLNALEKSSDFTRQHLVPGGTLMGVKAKGFKDAQAKGLIFDGVDGLPRFEVDDSGATAKTIDKAYKYGKPQKLADLIDHPQLFENYPDLARTEVSFMKNVPEKFHADYNPQTGTINLNDKFIGADGKLNPKGVAALLHETQHGIQAKERFAMGADLDGGNKAYWNSAGEAEARAVQARMNMPMSERYVKGKQYYHGSPDADKIRKEGFKIGERTADKRAPVFGDGVYMTTIKDAAEPYAKRGAFKSATGEVLEVNIPENLKLADVSVDDAFKPKVIERLKKQGYDGVRNDDIVNIFDPKKVNLGKATPRSTFYDSLDVPKKDLIIRNGGGKAMSIDDPTAALKQEALKYKTADEFTKAIQDGKVEVPKLDVNDPQLAQLQKQLGIDYTNAYDTPTGVYDMQKKAVTDLWKAAHTELAGKSTKIKQTPKVEAPQATAAPVQKPNIDPNRNSSQRSGRQNPLPDNKARTGRTYPDDTPDIDTAQYVKDMGRSQKSAMQSESGFKAKFADFKEKFIDDLSPIEDRLNKAIKDGASVDVKDHITYQLDRSRRAEGVMNAYVRDNGLDKIIQNVDNVDEFDQYLIARHAKELDPEITTGRDIAKDAALVRQLEGKYGEKAKELYAYNQKLLDTSVDYGLISKESAAALKKQYPDYVPFNRIFNEDELANLYGGAGKGDASLSSQNVVKKIKGSNRAIASPLNSIIDKTRVVVEQGERNRAAQMLANYRELPGNPYNLKEIPKNETIGTRHTISYLDKGVKRTFETDKVIADAAKNMTRQEIGLWGRIAAVPARVLRGGATTVNIGFAGANVVKDVIGAAINSKHPFRIADPKAFGKALSAALEHDGPYYQELMREGVAGTSFDMYRNPLKSNIGEIRSHKNLGTRAAYNVTHPSQWYRTLENTIGRSEDFGRALQYYSNKSGFEAKLGKGSKDAKTLAADQARHNSTNFFRHGSAGKGINLAIPYWNAGVQGARIQTRRIAERPVQTVAKIGFAIAAPSAMIAMNNYSTPERQEIMDNIQDYEKEGNIIILGANPHMNQETGKWEDVYKIPVPPQHIGIHTAVQDAVRSAKTGEGFDVLKNLGKITQNYTTVNPTNLRETASSYTPQALKLVAEPMTNTNFFTGNKIVPESQKNLPAKDQFGDYTSGTAKILGGITNISPRQIDNAIRTGTGGAGQNALWASDKMLAGTGAIEAKDVKGQDPLTSITRRFSGAASVSASDKAENLFKKYKEQVVQSNEYKNASQYDKQRMLNRLQNDLSAVEWDKTGKSEKNLTGKQKALKSDGFDPSVYTNLDAGSSDILSKYNNMSSDERENWFAKNNDAEYKYYKAKYENDKANGEISKIEDIRRQKMLKKDEVGAKYTKDTRDLYSLSKAEVSDYLSSAKNGNQLAKELIAYDEALYNAGLVKYKKFRYGFASSSGGGRSRGGRKSSRNGAKKFSYSLSEFAPKKGTSKNKQLYDLLKEARKKYA